MTLQTTDDYWKEQVAKYNQYNIYVSEDQMRQPLEEATDVYIRRGLANHDDTKPEVLAVLAGDEDAAVRRGVAFNPNTVFETLKVLFEDEDEWVGAVAGLRRETCLMDFIETLSGEKRTYLNC